MDKKDLYEGLTQQLKASLPLKALPIRELIHAFKEKVHLTLKTDVTITEVYNSGDISGILCTIDIEGKKGMACALTHLMFRPGSPLYKEIADYQHKRVKRIIQLNKMSGGV